MASHMPYASPFALDVAVNISSSQSANPTGGPAAPGSSGSTGCASNTALPCHDGCTDQSSVTAEGFGGAVGIATDGSAPAPLPDAPAMDSGGTAAATAAAAASSAGPISISTGGLPVCRSPGARDSSHDRRLLADERLHQAWDGLAIVLFVLTTALDIAVCCVLFHAGEALLWPGVAALGALLAPSVLLCLVVVHRLQWMAVALRFAASVLSFRPGGMLEFGRVKWAAPRLVLRWLALGLFVAIGGTSTVYLGLCYMVTALLSLPALDLAAAISLLPQRRHFQRGDLVFLENYKAARLGAQAALQSLPMAALHGVLLGLKAAGVGSGGDLGGALERVPYALLAVALAFAVLNVVQRLAQVLWQQQACGSSLGTHVRHVLSLRGASRVPPYVTEEALAAMLPEGGGKLSFSNVWYWAGDGAGDGSDAGDAAAAAARVRLPLVPRYLFPSDGGWLVPGQLSRLAHLAFVRHGGSEAIREWEMEHLGGQELGPLLARGIEALPGLRCITLTSCKLNGRAMRRALPLLASHAQLRRLRLLHCTITPGAATAISDLLSASTPLALLQISRCHLNAASAAAIAAGLAANRGLLSMNFSGNGAGRACAEAFAAAMTANGTLRHLNLSFNRLSPSGGALLAQALSSSSSLERLVLQRKEVGGQGLAQLVEVLRARTNTTGPLTLSRHPTLPCALHIQQLPLTFICSQDLDTLLNEHWLQPGATAATAAAPAPLLPSSSSAGTTDLAATAAAAPLPAAAAAGAAAVTAAEVAAAGSSAAARLLTGAMSAGELSIIGEEVEGSVVLGSVASGALSSVHMGHAASQDLGVTAADTGRGAAASSGSHAKSAAAAVAAAAAAAAVSADCEAGPDVLPGGRSKKRDQDAGSAAGGSKGSHGVPTGCSRPPPLCVRVPPAATNTAADNAAPPATAAALGMTQSTAAAMDAVLDAAAASHAGSHLNGDLRSGLEAVACPALVLLSQNDVCDTIAAVMRHVQGLGEVDVAGLQLGDRGTKAVAAALADAPTLTRLRLSDCFIFDEGAAALVAALPACTSLQQLDLSSNTVCDEAAAALCGALEGGAVPALGRLSLADNRYPFSWETLSRLQRLTVRPAGLTRLQIELVAHQSSASTAVAAAAGSSFSGVAPGPLLEGGLPGFAHAASGAAAALQLPGSRTPSAPASPTRGARGSSSSSGGNGSHAHALSHALSVAALGAAGAAPHSGPHHHRPSHHRRTVSAGSGTWSVASEDLCGVCFDRPNHLHVRDCGHRLCVECYRHLCRPRGRAAAGVAGGAGGCALCPFCRGPISGFVYAEWLQQAAAGGVAAGSAF